jgi:DNA invertase Pin-like site-specific DNA recombinase
MDKRLVGKVIASYVRISSDLQDATRQEQGIAEWARQQGVEIQYRFKDAIGKNPRDKAEKRVEFQRLLRFVEGGAVQVVVVDSQDRFGTKDNAEFWSFIHLLRKHGCTLWTVAQGAIQPEDDATVFQSTAGELASLRERKEKGWRSLTSRMAQVKAGQYAGGYPAYGLDVCCYGSDGKEKWRLVWYAKDKRVKVLPDGTRQAYDGKNNTPSHDRQDVLRYQPTILTDRLKVVRDIFKWYLEECISPHQIASRLRQLGIAPVYNEGWSKVRIRAMLGNPAYIGFPCANKRAGSRYWEYNKGELRPVVSENGKVKMGRAREAADYIMPDKQVFKPIVPVALFNKVQTKLQAESANWKEKCPKPRSPRTVSLWARNIVFCPTCDKPMRCWNTDGKGNPYRSYFCPNYGTYGKNNPTGCKSNRVKAEVIEAILERYLEETQEKIARLLTAHGEQSLEALAPMEGELETARKDMHGVVKRLRQYVGMYDADGKIAAELAGRGTEADMANKQGRVVSDGEVYRVLFDKRKPQLERELVALDAEHTELVDRVLSLDGKAKGAIQKANKRLVELEGKMQAARDELENLSDRLAEVIREWKERLGAIETAREAIEGDSGYRRKMELVRQVIRKAVCHFDYTEGKRAVLRSVEVFPSEGGSKQVYPNGGLPGRGCCQSRRWQSGGGSLGLYASLFG